MEIFQGLPDRLAEVNARIAETDAQCGAIHVDPKAKEEYEAIAAKEATLRADEAACSTSISAAGDLFAAKAKRLGARLTQHAQSLSMRFARFMTRIKCRGLISFMQDASDIKGWGLSVKVAFRPGSEPSQLNKSEQSGGECSVATMLVLLAMQETTPLPFRVVDEINQGMGANYERCVFEVLSDLFEKSDAAAMTTVMPSARSVGYRSASLPPSQ